MSSTAILLAAGSGSRMQGSVSDKVLTPLCGTPALLYSVRAFVESGCIDHFTVVYRDEAQREELEATIKAADLGAITVDYAEGGCERQYSVENALAKQSSDCRYVFIHDCARPLVSANSIQALGQAARQDGAAVLAHPVTDTIKRIPAADQLQSTKLEDLERNRLWAMETPQAFSYAKIRQAYEHVRMNDFKITDDTAAAATIGLGTTIVPNEAPNPKLTTPADLAYIEHLISKSSV